MEEYTKTYVEGSHSALTNISLSRGHVAQCASYRTTQIWCQIGFPQCVSLTLPIMVRKHLFARCTVNPRCTLTNLPAPSFRIDMLGCYYAISMLINLVATVLLLGS